jgi:hypothetical protein
MEKIARVFESYAPSENEVQTEGGLVKPVLRILGHNLELQPRLSAPDGPKRPAQVFYRDATSLDASKNRTLNEDPCLPRRPAEAFSRLSRRISVYESIHGRRVGAP